MTSTILASAGLPVLGFPAVFHVGSMDPGDKGRILSTSLEGSGLSVSLEPDAWRSIARLGRAPTWELVAGEGGGKFLDVLRLTDDQRSLVMAWGIDAGLARVTTAYEVSWYDSEMDERVSTVISDRDAAEAEFRGLEDQDSQIREIQKWVRRTSWIASLDLLFISGLWKTWFWRHTSSAIILNSTVFGGMKH